MMVETVIGLAILCGGLFGFRAFKRKPPSLESRISRIEIQLASEPDNGALHLLKAELSLRASAPWACLKSLEQAFEANEATDKLEPTFWGCYRSITSERYGSQAQERNGSQADYQLEQSLWRKLQHQAPKLMKSMATGVWESELKFKSRETDEMIKSDQAARLALFNSSDGRVSFGNEHNLEAIEKDQSNSPQ